MKIAVITIIVIFNALAYAQPELDIKPNRIEFEDLFNRVDHTFLINKGNAILTIDSLIYNDSLYIINYEDNLQPPFTILPDDSVRMTVLLSGFYEVTLSDTSDTIFVFNNGIKNPERLEVRIRFFEDEFGEINGTVNDSLNLVNNATVYFFYNGVYLLDTAMTSSAGYYRKTLPEGDYTIGVEKEGYYIVFHDSTYDPFFAEFVSVDSGSVRTIDFNLLAIQDTNYSVSGMIIDSTTGINANKGIIIVRTGTHVPTPKANANSTLLDTLDAFAGFIREDGTFKVYTQLPNYYFLQAYSNYLLPGYFNEEGIASVYWQNADSVYINQNITDKNISLVTDSSYGNGTISGFITYSNSSQDESNFEGITVLAKNINNDALYSYNFGKEFGDYRVSNIPYGTYELIAQKIGIDNAISQTVTIDPITNQITGININFIISDVRIETEFPDEFILYQNYPNPFNPSTTIKFRIPEREFVKLNIYDILGNEITTLINEELSPGEYEVEFSAESSIKNLASGIYFCTLKSGSFFQTKKMILLK